MRRRLLALALAGLALSGCWDFRGMDQRAFVVMMGIDLTESNRYRISMQMPVAHSGPAKGGGQGQEKGLSQGFRVVHSEGRTVQEAMERARGDVARELDLSFLENLVLSRRAANNLEDLDWIVRNFPVPSGTFVSVTLEDPAEVVTAPTPGFDLPGEYLSHGYSGQWNRSGAIVPVPLWLIFNRLIYSPLEDPYAPIVTSQKNGLNWAGLAVFRRDEFAGDLTEQEAWTFSLLKSGRIQRSISATEVPGRESTVVSLKVVRGKARRWVTWSPEGPILHASVTVSGDLAEMTHMRAWSPGEQAQVERALAEELTEQTERLINRLQELGSDALGYGELARRSAPHRSEVQSENRWRSSYREAPVQVSAQVSIIASGYMR